MIIRRTLPPTAAPIYCRDIVNGLVGMLRGGPEIERFESEIREYFGVRHCFTLSSGRAALTVILRALHALHPERTVVVIPAYTCYSVAASIVRASLSIRLCDIDARTLDFNYAELQAIITHDSKELLAIIPAHLFGLPSDIDRLKNITSGHDIFIVEDAAQAFGGKDSKGNKLGTKGDVGFFSLGRGKPMTTVEGGIIVTNGNDIARGIEKQVRRTRQCSMTPLIIKALLLALFIHPGLYWFPKSLSFLKIGETIYDEKFKLQILSSFQAGLSNGWQHRIESLKHARRSGARRFLSIDQRDAFHRYFSDVNTLPDLLRFPLLCRDASFREDQTCRGAMERMGVVPYYPTAINRIGNLKDRFTGERYPEADRVAVHLITLPIHPLVSEHDADEIHKLLEKLL